MIRWLRSDLSNPKEVLIRAPPLAEAASLIKGQKLHEMKTPLDSDHGSPPFEKGDLGGF